MDRIEGVVEEEKEYVVRKSIIKPQEKRRIEQRKLTDDGG